MYASGACVSLGIVCISDSKRVPLFRTVCFLFMRSLAAHISLLTYDSCVFISHQRSRMYLFRWIHAHLVEHVHHDYLFQSARSRCVTPFSLSHISHHAEYPIHFPSLSFIRRKQCYFSWSSFTLTPRASFFFSSLCWVWFDSALLISFFNIPHSLCISCYVYSQTFTHYVFPPRSLFCDPVLHAY